MVSGYNFVTVVLNLDTLIVSSRPYLPSVLCSATLPPSGVSTKTSLLPPVYSDLAPTRLRPWQICISPQKSWPLFGGQRASLEYRLEHDVTFPHF